MNSKLPDGAVDSTSTPHLVCLPMRHDETIRKLGGYKRVADALGRSHAAVAQWLSRSAIPPAYWVDVAEMARRRGLRGITVRALQEAWREDRKGGGSTERGQ